MDIDTGDSPPVCQKPYNLPLKHREWVQKELETLERAGVIVRSISPWASPIVIVPKKTEPGEPPRRRLCVDYRVINSLLPEVQKAHSKAKGVLTLVPFPQIDHIYVVPPQSWGDRSDTKHSKCLLLGGRRLNQLTLIPKPKGSGGARAATAQVGPANERNDTKRCLPVEASLRPGEAVPW